MREIVTDWGVDHSYFQKLYKTLQGTFGHGVTLYNDRMQIDNQFAKGDVVFLPFENGIALLQLNMSFAEPVSFRRVIESEPNYYACLFSLKEGVDLHVFGNIEEDEMRDLGLSAKHSVLYFSSDVQTLFRVIPNEQTKVLILIFAKDALDDLLFYTIEGQGVEFRPGQSIKGYTSMNGAMVDKVTDVFEHASAKHIPPLYLLGGVYELFAVLLQQLHAERNSLAESTGVVEVARMIHIRNLLVADFSHDCPLLEEMAKKAQMSVTKFKSLFKKLFRLPYYQYYQRYRLLAAKQSLILGKSVSETAYEFSFGSVSNFSVAFKKMFNMSPSEIERLPGDLSAIPL